MPGFLRACWYMATPSTEKKKPAYSWSVMWESPTTQVDTMTTPKLRTSDVIRSVSADVAWTIKFVARLTTTPPMLAATKGSGFAATLAQASPTSSSRSDVTASATIAAGPMTKSPSTDPNLRSTSKICIVMSLMASKTSDASMTATPYADMWTSPWTATAVPAEMIRIDSTRTALGRSRRLTNNRTISTTGAKAFKICTKATLL
mmetsp:Transcript_7448/g.24502  ORF Transcript_7448/g.24502 Transcript_7448/m.24502 type:complete len:204 (+) Transcript_7448:104-715(+)